MNGIFSRSHLCLFILISMCAFVAAPFKAVAAPVLNFSDIDSGPKTGNSDGAGLTGDYGAIVTIWGNNLGSTRSDSKVFVGNVEAKQVYYWKDADGKLPGGPADLKSFHRMQEIAFAVPSGAADGANTIKVVVRGVASNTLPFTVRSGNIYFLKSTGNDSTGNGSWLKPWKTLATTFAGNNARLVPGDIIYSVGVGAGTGINVGAYGAIKGTAASPVSLIAYPGSYVSVSGKSYTGYVIFNYYYTNAARMSEYINLSKLSVTAAGDGDGSSSAICVSKGNRIAGVEITGPTVYGGYGGAITGNNVGAGGGKYYGIYIHNYGTDNKVAFVQGAGTSPSNCPYTTPSCKSSYDIFQHLYYISNRNTVLIDGYEIGWNHLTDNPIYQGIHIYDMGTTAGWSGKIQIHDNVVRNQRGNAINVSYPGTTPIEIYNNIVISDRYDTYNDMAIEILGGTSAKVYNNTIYGYNNTAILRPAFIDFRNNLLVDTKGKSFIYDTLTSQSNNLFYSMAGTPKPAWATAATGNLYTDPLFVNVAAYNFNLQGRSPALGAGYDTTATVPRDFFGQPRQPGSVSIGAVDRSAIKAPLPK